MSTIHKKIIPYSLMTAILSIATTNLYADDAATTKSGEQVLVSPQKNIDWGTLNATASLTTNYVWRGVSQTQNRPAAQASITYSHPWGVYAGIWGSNVDFPDTRGKTATSEFDVYGGWKNTFSQLDDLGVDVGLLRYNYPNTHGIDWTEYYAGLNYKIFDFYVNWSPNTFDLHNGIYYSGGVSYDIPANYLWGIQGFGVGAHVGYYDLDDKTGNSYWDWKLSVSKTLTDHFSASIDYTDTNEKYAVGDHGLDDAKFVFTLTATI